MINQLESVLTQHQYEIVRSNVPNITLYVQDMFSYAQVVQVIDCSARVSVNSGQYQILKDRAVQYVRTRGYEDVRILTLIVTPYSSEVREFTQIDDDCWILDTWQKRLIIYENQSDDFSDVKFLIENMLSGESQFKGGSKWEENTDSIQKGAIAELAAEAAAVKARKNYKYSFDGSFYLTPVNLIFIVINLVVFFYLAARGSTLDAEYMLEKGAMFVPAVLENHEIYRFVTCMFMHFGFDHLFGNMVVLLFLGACVEREIGYVKYAMLYFVGGLIGSIGSFMYSLAWNHNIVSAGASGAIFAVIGSLLWIVIKNHGRIENMTTFRVIVMILYALYSGFTSEKIDMAAHIFGLIGGFVLAVVLYRERRNEF